MAGPRRRDRQVAVFLLGLLLANFPALAVVDRITLPGGIPLTPLYLFVVWVALVVLTMLLVARRRG
jgi:hypothetical protein